MRHVLIVLASAREGCDDELNTWYTNEHLPDLLAIDGVCGAQRFELAETEPPQRARHRYLAIYEIEDGKLDGVRDRVYSLVAERDAALRDGRETMLSMSDALGERVHWWFTAITEPLRAAPAEVAV